MSSPVHKPIPRVRAITTGLIATSIAMMLSGSSDELSCPQTLSKTFRNHSELKWILFDTAGKLNTSGQDAVNLGCALYPHTDAAQGIDRPTGPVKTPSGPTRANGPVS